jgi:uncharacterized Zn-finger protein
MLSYNGSRNKPIVPAVDTVLPSYSGCGICHQGFEDLERLVAHSEATGHLALQCRTKSCYRIFSSRLQLETHERSCDGLFRCEEPACGKTFYSSNMLGLHARNERHRTFKCVVNGCNHTFDRVEHLHGHEAHEHVWDHRQIEVDNPLACIECHTIFPSRAQLQGHTESKQHSPFQCICGTKFARVDVLHRHIDSHGKEIPMFPCTFCKLHRGRQGFRRRDHLVQHLRGYHKFDSDEIENISPAVKTNSMWR